MAPPSTLVLSYCCSNTFVRRSITDFISCVFFLFRISICSLYRLDLSGPDSPPSLICWGLGRGWRLTSLSEFLVPFILHPAWPAAWRCWRGIRTLARHFIRGQATNQAPEMTHSMLYRAWITRWSLWEWLGFLTFNFDVLVDFVLRGVSCCMSLTNQIGFFIEVFFEIASRCGSMCASFWSSFLAWLDSQCSKVMRLP